MTSHGAILSDVKSNKTKSLLIGNVQGVPQFARTCPTWPRGFGPIAHIGAEGVLCFVSFFCVRKLVLGVGRNAVFVSFCSVRGGVLY